MHIAAKKLLDQPTTNENTSFVFKFGKMSYALNVGKYRRIKARRPNGHCLYVHVHNVQWLQRCFRIAKVGQNMLSNRSDAPWLKL